MPHIILLGCLNDLAGDAETGVMAELRDACIAADALLQETVNEPLHDLLETIEPVVCSTSTQMAGFTEDVNKLM
jgi:hypothetical protein